MPVGGRAQVALRLGREHLGSRERQLGPAVDPLQVAGALDAKAQRRRLAERHRLPVEARGRAEAADGAAEAGLVRQRLDVDRDGLRGALDAAARVEEAGAGEADAEDARRDRERAGLRREQQLLQDREAPVALPLDRGGLARGRGLVPLEVFDPEAAELRGLLELQVGHRGLRVEPVGQHERLADLEPRARRLRLHQQAGRLRAAARRRPKKSSSGSPKGSRPNGSWRCGSRGRTCPATTSIAIAGGGLPAGVDGAHLGLADRPRLQHVADAPRLRHAAVDDRDLARLRTAPPPRPG